LVDPGTFEERISLAGDVGILDTVPSLDVVPAPHWPTVFPVARAYASLTRWLATELGAGGAASNMAASSVVSNALYSA